MLSNSDIHDWNITFADTGSIRISVNGLKAVRKVLAEKRKCFSRIIPTALRSCILPSMIDHFQKHNAMAMFLSAPPNLSFHIVSACKTVTSNEIRK